MDNFKLTANDDHKTSNQLISERAAKRTELSIAQVNDLPGKEAGATMLDEITNHFKTTFSNVAEGKASASEYLEVGAIALGTAAVGTFAAGRMMQRNAPLVLGRSESTGSALAPNAAASIEQTNVLASNVIKFERNSAGATGAMVNKGAMVVDDGYDMEKTYAVMDDFAAAARKHSAVETFVPNVVNISESTAGKLAPKLSSSEVRSGLATVDEGSVSIAKNTLAWERRVNSLRHQATSIRWRPPKGSGGNRSDIPMSPEDPPLGPNAIFEFDASYTSNKELASILPEVAGFADDLWINLKGSINVTDEGLKHFIKAKDTLKKLDLSGTSVTEYGATRIRMALPNTEIFFDKSQALSPLGRAIANASMEAPIRPWERAKYQWVPPRDIAEVVFRQPH